LCCMFSLVIDGDCSGVAFYFVYLGVFHAENDAAWSVLNATSAAVVGASAALDGTRVDKVLTEKPAGNLIEEKPAGNLIKEQDKIIESKIGEVEK